MLSHMGETVTLPTESGEEWNLYLSYINQAQTDWAEGYAWKQLYKQVNTFSAGATVTFPTDFRKFDGPMLIATDGATFEYQKINPEEVTQKNEVDKYFYVLGNKRDGYSAIVNPATLASTSSIFYSYWASAPTLSAGTDITPCSDPQYLVERALTYYWRAEDDSRFLVAERNADLILRRMLEFEQVEGQSYDDRIKTYEETRSSFRIGRD